MRPPRILPQPLPEEEEVDRHDGAARGDVGGHALPDPAKFPQGAREAGPVLVGTGPSLPPVEHRGTELPHVRHRADQQEDDGEEGGEVEDGRHWGVRVRGCWCGAVRCGGGLGLLWAGLPDGGGGEGGTVLLE